MPTQATNGSLALAIAPTALKLVGPAANVGCLPSHWPAGCADLVGLQVPLVSMAFARLQQRLSSSMVVAAPAQTHGGAVAAPSRGFEVGVFRR